MTVNGFENWGDRIGLLGGTFDPVHFGHLAVAKAVRELLSLDSVVFIPAFQPPHKYSSPLSSFLQRSAMLELVLGPRQEFHISYMEARRNGPSFTCDTLEDVRLQVGDEVKLFFITGIDAFLEINTWKRYESLLRYADLVVITRPPYDEESVKSFIGDYFPFHLYDKAENAWISPSVRGGVRLLSMLPVAISSTDIRERVRRGGDVAGMVPESVAAYIKQEGLYEK